jgi:hypothetical protein
MCVWLAPLARVLALQRSLIGVERIRQHHRQSNSDCGDASAL